MEVNISGFNWLIRFVFIAHWPRQNKKFILFHYICFYSQGGVCNSYYEIGERYGLKPTLSESDIQQKLVEVREKLKLEIRKEMKIKEGAEKLRDATSKRNISNVNSIVKKANTKLQDLQEELQEVNAYLLVSNKSFDSQPGKYSDWCMLTTLMNTFYGYSF